MAKNLLLILILCSACFIESTAQDKKSASIIKKGDELFAQRNYKEAKVFYLKSLETYPSNALVHYKLGQIFNTERNPAEARKHYEETIALEPENKQYTLAYTFLASALQKEMEFAKAADYYKKAMENMSPRSPAYQQMQKEIATCEFAIATMSNPLVIDPKPMPEVLNFKDKQYFPAFTADGQWIFFTARSNGSDEDIYLSKKENQTWTTPESISNVINTNYNEGTCTISANGRTMVFTGCEGRQSFGSCDLFISYFENDRWSTPENMGKNINSSFWDSQASLSPDGKTIIFSSERYGGKGGKDLYISTLNNKNEWSLAQNLGEGINTNKDEVSPFLHANGSSLFFASNGHTGLGGYDIFLTNKEGKSYTKPLNLGYPINDTKDQFAMVIAADGKQAYYSVEKGDRVEMFQFDLPEQLKSQFNPTYYLKGVTKNKKTGEVLAAKIQLIDADKNTLLSEFKSDQKTGEFMAVVPSKGNYALYVESPNYFFKKVDFKYDPDKEERVNIELDKIEKDKPEILKNIYFDEAKWDIRPESLVELGKLAELIWQNPSLKVEISGHTDSNGNDADNQLLSEKRANEVVQYLLREGANKEQLSAKGYGESKPIADNKTEEGRQINRRIELRFY